MGDLEEELDLARSELEELQVKYDAALDEQDRKVAELEEECEQRVIKVEEESRNNIEELQADCDQKVDDLTDKLDKLRRAMTGDACGWVEKKDGRGDTVYENTESGESSYEKPEVLKFAETIQKVDGAAADKSNVAKLEQKAKDNEAKKRESDVKYNESRAETQNLRGLNNAWKSSAEVIYYSFLKYDENISKVTNKLIERSDYIAEKTDNVVRAREGVDKTISKVAEIQLVLNQREEEIKRLLGTIGKLHKMVERAEAEIALLRTSVVAQIEKVASPLRDELAASYTLTMQEKAGRELDRQQLADLWPDGWLMPSLLQKYRTLSKEERLEKRKAAQDADAERRLKAEIRQKVLDATKWSQGFDEYGRAYFVHADTDEQEWDMPEAMAYTPPPGRDEFGNKVTTSNPRSSQTTINMKNGSGSKGKIDLGDLGNDNGGGDGGNEDGDEKVASEWEIKQDEWGQTFYLNSETGEETWERPEELGDEVVANNTPQIGLEFDPKTRATLCARVTIEWLRNAQSRQLKEEDDDDDHVMPVEGEQVDEDALMYDMKTVEELASGDDNWEFEPAEDEEDDDDDDDSDDENENGALDGGIGGENGGEKKKKGPPSIPTLRSEVYKAALEEEELESKLRHCRRKVERISKHLIDRIQEIEKAEKESIVSKSTAMDDEGQAQVKNALAELEASMAAAANAFAFGAVDSSAHANLSNQIDGSSDDQKVDLKKEHEANSDRPMAPVDADTLWAELSHRRIVDAAMPRGHVEDDACYDLAIEAVWAGLADIPISEPPYSHWEGPDEEWRARAFFARGAEEKDEDIIIPGEEAHQPVLVCLQQHMKHQTSTSQALTIFEKARHAAMKDTELDRAMTLSSGAESTAKAAKFKHEDYRKAPQLKKEKNKTSSSSSQHHRENAASGQSSWFAKSDDDPPPYVKETPYEPPYSNPAADEARLEKQTNELNAKMKEMLTQDAIDAGVELPNIKKTPDVENIQSKHHHSRNKKKYIPPKSKIIEQAELHVASLLPLLLEADVLRAKLWEAHEVEQEKVDGWVDDLKNKFFEQQEMSNDIRNQQIELSQELRTLLIARVPPVPPPTFTMIDKVLILDPDMILIELPPLNSPPPPDDLPIPTTSLLDVNEFRIMESNIVSGEYDGKTISLPSNRHANEALKISLEKLIEKRNAKITEREKRRYDHEMARYEKKRLIFDNAELEHGNRLENARNQLRTLDLQDKVIKSNLSIVGRWLSWAEEEANLIVIRADGMYSCEMKSQAFRGKQIVEGIRGVEALSRLQDELHTSMTNRRGAIQLAGSARNAIEKLSLEREKSDIVALARADVFRLRELMLEEGRRRRWLYQEELATAQMELRRLRDLMEARKERGSNLALIQGMFQQLNQSTASLWASRQEEVRAAAANVLPNFSDVTASERIVFHEKCLSIVLQARTEGQLREKRLVSEHRGLVMMQIPLPPDQWLPQAERRRYEEENWALRSRLETSVRHLRGVSSVNERRRQDAESEVRRVMITAIGQRDASSKALTSAKETWEHSMTMLKLMMDTQRDEMAQEISRYQRALSELAREYSSVRLNLTAKAEHLALRVKDLTSWLAACRYDLSVETARRIIGDEERKRIIYQWRRESDALRAELVMERMHTARLEVWIAAMRQDVGNFIKEIWLRERMLELQKQTNEEELKGLRKCIWKNSTGLNRVSTDVNALFLFFAQRLAGLAGSRRHYNEALRANGAAAVLAALCKSPRQDLRRVAARALGMMGWDGYMEQRLIAFEAKRSWELWLEQVIPEEENRLSKLGLTFMDRAPTAGDDHDEVEFEPPEGVHWRALIVARRQWALRNARRKEGPNLANMKLLGGHKDILSVLIMLTHEADTEVVRGAALALSVAAFHEQNNGTMGRMPECVDALVRLCSSPDPEVCSQAAASLANLGYGHALNQRLIGEAGGLENLLDLCCTNDVDVIESSTAALANLVCLHKDNAVKLSSVGGLQVLLRLISSAIPANLLDSDQMSEIQANSAEALANLTANFGEENSAQVHTLGVAPLVLLCGSGNLQVRRHAALVLGNVAQKDEHRSAIGLRGGIEALFLLCEQNDEVTKANALWALGNMAWHPTNQDRIGRYFDQLLMLCNDSFLPIQTNAMVCLANALFYHDRNRSRVEELPMAVSQIVTLCGGRRTITTTGEGMDDSTSAESKEEEVSGPIQEASLRALVSLSYTDRLCLALGSEHNVFPMLIKNCSHGDKINIHKFSLMVILNLVSSDDNKRILLATPGAIEALVESAGSKDEEVVKLGEAIMTCMSDLRAVEELRAKKGEFGVSGMLEFLKSNTVDSTTKRLAIESLAEQLWLEPAKQAELASCGGIEVIMEICESWRRQDEKMLLPALWALRNVTHENDENKDRVGSLHGVDVLLELSMQHTGAGSGHILESTLSALINMCIGHERNCRRVLKHGLDDLLDIAESDPNELPHHMEDLHWDETMGVVEKQRALERRRGAVSESQKTNQALATSLLQIVGPFNWVVCQNCRQKNYGGSTCSNCGHSVTFS